MDKTFKLRNKEAISPVPVINLSNSFLRQEEINLLAKGLKFIPKPSKSNYENVEKALSDFSRRIKLTIFFECLKKQDHTDSAPTPFREKSKWTPSDKFTDDFTKEKLAELITNVKEINLRQTGQNMSKADYRALKMLRKRNDIILKPADKGSSTVILSKSDYISEANRQLSDLSYYEKINDPIYPTVSGKINEILEKLVNDKFIDEKQGQYLSVPEIPRSRLFYLLPKIHKDRHLWTDNKIPPGRPIVSDCNSDSYRISAYIDSFLQPLAVKHPSYIKDTFHFLERLKAIQPSEESYLVTIDVESLYTNINNADGLCAIQSMFESHPEPKRSDRGVYDLLKICLENNDFEFNNEWYLQKSGTAMGKKFAPNYANIFLAKWEQEALDKCPLKPSCYFRFLDDIFIIWPYSKEEFDNFFSILNSHHRSIKLKASISKTHIDFLDVTIFKGPRFRKEGILDTKVYFKPTNSRQLLHKHSYHPKHTFKGIIKSQILRYYWICSNTSDFNEACTGLFQSLSLRGYSKRFLRTIKTQTLLSFKSSGRSRKCLKDNCLTCPYLIETDHMISSKGNIIPLQQNLDCRSEGVIYVIKCKACGIMYVGQTIQELHARITEHRSTINTGKSLPVAVHFNNVCPGINNFSVIPLEQVEREDLDEFMGLYSIKDLLRLSIREQHWMAKLKTLMPKGLNIRKDYPPPIPFVIQYSDQASEIAKLVKHFYGEIRGKYFCGPFVKFNLVTAFKRNKNLKDYLVHAKL